MLGIKSIGYKMKDKQTFIFYRDWSDVISNFDTDVQLEIYQSIVEYAFNGSIIEMQPTTKIAFGFIKPQIDRDTEKYNAIVERNRENGKFGGRPKKPNKPNGLFGNPKNLDNDNDNDNVNENENDLKELTPDFSKKEIELNSVFEIISKDKDWIKTIGINNQLKSENSVLNHLRNFRTKLENEGVTEKSISDTKKHFSNWLKIELRILRA